MKQSQERHYKYDVVVVGAGHAGCEAALAAARMGCEVLVLAINIDKIALMPCNPSIGGIGKGQLVREIDALGGEMGRTIDQAMVQIKVLNSSKGPAVQALRAQADKRKYSFLMKTKLLKEPKVSLRQAEVVDLRSLGDYQIQVIAADGTEYLTKCVIVSTGTFLRGELVVGSIKRPGGRTGELPSSRLSPSLRKLGLEMSRFQSATPPRVSAIGLDYQAMALQPGDRAALSFSFSGQARIKRIQRDCYLTYTNKRTHEVISNNLHLSPIKSGSVSARGPRYCPSIDRKVINFPDRERHPVFVEPEGWLNEEMYLQGLTTSMPVEIQEKIIRTVPGLENARLMRPGYAVSYDYLLPHQLKNTLETHAVPGLFTAGQINGTSGYEEAAAQGLMAGINAALICLGRPGLVIDRAQAYIGVLIDDLVTKEIDEPYRMFTSRAEHRLVLRSDNADLRLAHIGHQLGLVGEDQFARVQRKRAEIKLCLDRLSKVTIREGDFGRPGTAGRATKQAYKAKDLLKRPEVTIEHLTKIVGLGRIPKTARHQAEIEVKYEGYIRRQIDQIAAQKRLEDMFLPDIDYNKLTSLSTEARQKLDKIKPSCLGQAARIAGVTPADISVLMVHMEQCRRTL